MREAGRLTPSDAASLSAVAAAALALFWLVTRGATGMTPDGWAYWQGAYALSDEGRYTYFSGVPMISWPPTYSAYLLLFSPLFGWTGIALAISNGVLVLLSALGWALLYRSATARDRTPIASAAFGMLLTFLACFLALNLNSLLAHNLLVAALPYLILCWQRIGAGGAGSFLVIALLSALVANVHNTGLAFVGALIIATLLQRSPLWSRLRVSTALALPAVLIWLLLRDAYDLAGSHLLVSPHYSFAAYLGQIVAGFGRLWSAEPIALLMGVAGLAIVAIASVSLGSESRARDLAILGFTATFLQWVMFSLTWVGDPFDGRFLWGPLLLMTPAVFATGASFVAPARAPKNLLSLAALGFIAAACLSNGCRAVNWILAPPRVYVVNSVPAAAVLSPDLPAGARLQQGSVLFVSPPRYRWETNPR